MKKNISLILLIVTLLILIWACGLIRNEIISQEWLKGSDGFVDCSKEWFDICYGSSFGLLFVTNVFCIFRNIFDR